MYWLIFSVVLVVLLKIYFARIKGFIGERRVAKQLEKLPPDSYKVLNDVMVINDGISSQIDHVVISPYGVFVIETKNFTGWIHGNEKSDYWTQTIYKSKNKFRNPIKQNWGHVYALIETLKDYDKDIFIPIVLFAGDAELKNIKAGTDVIYGFKLYRTIMKYKDNKLTASDIETIYDTIEKNTVSDKKSKKKHVQDIKNNVRGRKIKEQQLNCPKCGGNLIVREGKYGKFYGCSNFPGCRYNKAC